MVRRSCPALTALLLACFVFSHDGLTQNNTVQDKQHIVKPKAPEFRRDIPPSLMFPDAPPPGPVASVAEWEESEGVMTLWENWDLIDKLQQHIPVYIPVDNNSQKNWWINYLNSHGVPLTNINFLFITTDTIYTRDYGPWFIWDNNRDLGIVNYTCGYGPNDDLFPQHFAALFGIDFYESGLNHVGGNWYPNAYERAFSTTLVYTQNGEQSMDAVNQAMYDFYGIGYYHTVVVAPWTIEHHDCWGKPSNPETMIVCQFDEDSEYYPYGEYVNDHYETLQSPWGRPYKIIRIPMFKMGTGWYEFRPYLNALVSNTEVYVAVTNHPDDQKALAIFQEAFPGYNIIGVDHMGTGFNDALHCRTRNFVKRDAIRMYPGAPGDTEDTVTDYPVYLQAIPPKGSTLLAGYPKLFWTETGGPPFNEIVMSYTGQPYMYYANIPARPLGTKVDFYFEAMDDGGHSAIYPLVAPKGMLGFEVRTDTETPVLSRHVAVRSSCETFWLPRVRTLCKDDMTTPSVRFEYSINNKPFDSKPMSRVHPYYWYDLNMNTALYAGDVLKYRLVAEDHSSSGNTDRLPKVGEIYCPIVAQGESVGLVDLSRRPFTAPLIAETLGDLGIPYTYHRYWPTDFDDHDVWFFCLGVFADNYVLSGAEVADLAAALQAGDSIYLETGDGWCYDPEKDNLKPLFGVFEVSDGGDLSDGVIGQPATIVDGIALTYAGVNAYVDEIAAVTGAEVIFRSDSDNAGRTVLYDQGTCRTIASSFQLGGLLDDAWPETRKEILLRYLEFLGIPRPALVAKAPAEAGTTVQVRLDGDPGDGYILLASLADNYLDISGYGTLRLDPDYLFIYGQGMIPPSGKTEFLVPIPRDPDYVGMEVHLQAVVGEEFKPGKAALTNREILTIKE